MPAKSNLKNITVDDLLRQQEGPLRKKRRLSESEASSSDDEGSESDSSSGHHTRPYSQDDIKSPKRQTSTSASSQSSFASLGISPQLQGALKSMSIKAPTEVQSACIPPLLAGRDCIGNAKTGSGKTIAFALPILQKLAADPYGIYALVLTPTRELAFQISEQFAVLGNAFNIRTSVIVGGMDMMAQSIELGNRPHVVIATPGRIVDHLRSSSGEWDLSRVKFLVLDEADRLLTSTFSPELSHLFDVLPKERQTSEASPRPGKQKPFVHRMKETIETVSTLKQHYILVPSHVRESYLYHLLCNPPESTIPLRRAPPESLKNGKQAKSKPKPKKAKVDQSDEEPEQPPPTIIFCAKPKTAAYLTLLLKTLSIRSTALHSRLTQRERLSSLQLFRASVVPVLVSTDVGARGLDIEDVAMVINWDLPQEPEEYTHRVGRTARAGRGGVAVSFVTERDEERVLKIEDRIKTKLEEMTLPEDRVLNKLNTVSTAKRLANMELHDSNFGKREEIHQIKNTKRRNFAAEEGGV
ncbi:P-loop containing nucleoside triphosphate hydrolase protein [Pholiota molesta]|nr:P-loop containing nucleoside triphosphate hydrolase protein [Pholiota molesta]